MTGLVLAGGRSSRMGMDKALLRVHGHRLVDIAIDRLREVCERVLVVRGSRRIEGLQVEQLSDAGGGPLVGIVAGLRAATTDLVAVIGVDMPRADPAVLRTLSQLWEGGPAAAPVVGGAVQPLHAVYATAWTSRFAALVAAGERSPRRALAVLEAQLVDDSAWGPVAATADFTRSVNSPEDLAWASAPPATHAHG